ncbi:MAG: FAD-dependent monooxygenase, partial [Sphingomonas sp.]|nr:FAD-dependent monooxygenase [Sphingomonas sp.]
MDRADVIILGGGLVGLALASALDFSGISAILVDPADPDQRTA